MKKKKVPPLKIWQKTFFEFGHEHNAQKVAYALSSSGYLVRVSGGPGNYLVVVYTHKEPEDLTN